jgi:hypothetical protein
MDSSLLYGEMAGSALVHAAVPLLVASVITMMPYRTLSHRTMTFFISIIVISFIVQLAFLLGLQMVSCKGVKDYKILVGGAFIGAVLTGAMIAFPTFIESMRLVVSQLFIDHKSLLTEKMAAIDAATTDAGLNVFRAEVKEANDLAAALPNQRGGGAITEDQYEHQTLQEMMIGSSYWAAFAGAYGVGIGSLVAVKCKGAYSGGGEGP